MGPPCFATTVATDSGQATPRIGVMEPYPRSRKIALSIATKRAPLILTAARSIAMARQLFIPAVPHFSTMAEPAFVPAVAFFAISLLI